MRQAGFEPQASEAANAAEAEPTTFGSGDQHGQRTPALAVAVSRVSDSHRRRSTANDAFSVTIVVTNLDRMCARPTLKRHSRGMRSTSWVALLSAMAVASCGGGPVVSSPPWPIHCSPLSRDPVLRAVQKSLALRVAMAVIDTTVERGHSVSPPMLGQSCENMQVSRSSLLPNISLVFADAYDPGIAVEQMVFGVSGHDVVLLTAVDHDELSFRLDFAVWNSLIKRHPIRPLVSDSLASQYACLIDALTTGTTVERERMYDECRLPQGPPRRDASGWSIDWYRSSPLLFDTAGAVTFLSTHVANPASVAIGPWDPTTPDSAQPCSTHGRHGFPFGLSDELVRNWYSKQWEALNERNLCEGLRGARQVWRLVFVPTFNSSVAVILRDYRDSTVMEAKKLDGAGGYDPGKLVADTTFKIENREWIDFEKLLVGSGYLTQVGPSALGDDGAQWVLEWSNGGKYQVVDRWTPRSDGPAGAYRKLCEWLLARSGVVSADEVKGY